MAVENLLRFKDNLDNSVHDLNITLDSESEYYLGVNNRTQLTPQHDNAAALPVSSSASLYNQTATAIQRIRKVTCTGDTDGYFELFLDGSKIAFGKITPTERVWTEAFAGGILYVPIGALLQLRVTNTGRITSDFESIIYFEGMT